MKSQLTFMKHLGQWAMHRKSISTATWSHVKGKPKQEVQEPWWSLSTEHFLGEEENDPVRSGISSSIIF